MSATDILKIANFNVEDSTVTIHTVNIDKEGIFTEFEISKETQQEIIKAFENAKFKKITSSGIDYDYRINIILNSGHPMFLDSNKKSVTMIDTNEHYTIVNDSDFFDILEKSTK